MEFYAEILHSWESLFILSSSPEKINCAVIFSYHGFCYTWEVQVAVVLSPKTQHTLAPPLEVFSLLEYVKKSDQSIGERPSEWKNEWKNLAFFSFVFSCFEIRAMENV